MTKLEELRAELEKTKKSIASRLGQAIDADRRLPSREAILTAIAIEIDTLALLRLEMFVEALDETGRR